MITYINYGNKDQLNSEVIFFLMRITSDYSINVFTYIAKIMATRISLCLL